MKSYLFRAKILIFCPQNPYFLFINTCFYGFQTTDFTFNFADFPSKIQTYKERHLHKNNWAQRPRDSKNKRRPDITSGLLLILHNFFTSIYHKPYCKNRTVVSCHWAIITYLRIIIKTYFYLTIYILILVSIKYCTVLLQIQIHGAKFLPTSTKETCFIFAECS